MSWNLLYAFLGALLISAVITPLIAKIARKFGLLDRPESDPSRKIQKKSVPLLGGLAIFLSFNLVVAIMYPELTQGYMLPKYLWAIFLAGLVLMIGGILDDRMNLRPKTQIVFPIIACLIIIASGIGIDYLTNPMGGEFRLDTFRLTLFEYGGLPYQVVLLADLFTFVWLMGMMYTTKILDGLDGLVSGITTIGAFILFFLSMTQEVYQPETAALALILAGAALGFFIYNFHPAKIYLGEGGSLFCGFMLGVLAIISGGKIATALLIMGIPILDVLWVIVRRVFFDKKSWAQADSKHLHYRLLDIGLTHRQAVLLLLTIAAVFGASSLYLESFGKLWALVIVVAVMILLAGIIYYKYKNHEKQA